MSNNVTTLGSGLPTTGGGARPGGDLSGRMHLGGFGPAGTGHPPPPDNAQPTAPFLDRVRLGLDIAHQAADRIESVLHRVEPREILPSKPDPEWVGHAPAISDRLSKLISRLNDLANRFEDFG